MKIFFGLGKELNINSGIEARGKAWSRLLLDAERRGARSLEPDTAHGVARVLYSQGHNVERPDLDPVELDDWRKYAEHIGHTEPGGLYTTDTARSRTADVANVPGSGVDFAASAGRAADAAC